MKYAREEQLEIGRKIYSGEITKYEASEQYDISIDSARDYMRLYRDVNALPPKNHRGSCTRSQATAKPQESLEEIQSMSREELIDALVSARINEARLKKDIRWKELVRTGSSFGSARRIPSNFRVIRSVSGKTAL